MIPFRVANMEKLKPSAEYRKNHKYYELPAALDIETTKTGNNPAVDFAFIYLWAFAIGDFVMYGRTPEDLAECIRIVKGELRLALDFRLVVFVHFLKYEFHFLKRYLQIEAPGFIARSAHEPLRVNACDCLEFRDSYAYTEQPLYLMGREIGIPKIPDYNYDEIRTPQTELRQDELQYQENDVRILTAYFEREANFYGGISRIPITATQRVKRVISSELDRFSEKIRWRVYGQQLDPRKDEDALTLKLLHIAFFGGFNFCNRLQAEKTIKSAYGADIDTSYGAQCLFHRFPRSRFKPLATMPGGIVPPSMLEDLKNGAGQFRGKALLITCEFTDLKARVPELAFLPIYCKNYFYRTLDRKKSMKTKHLSDCGNVVTCLTDVDFRLVMKWYTYKDLRIHSILASRYEPLPEYVQQAIIDMIAQKKATKAELKEVAKFRRITEEENAEYHRIKSMVSRIYGVFVQDPLRMDYTFDESSGTVKQAGIHGMLDDMEMKKKRFTPVLYQWGVWVASWARFEILQILERLAAIGGTERGGIRWNRKVLYCDTDCVKWFDLGAEAFEIINAYNDKKAAQLEAYCKRRELSPEWLRGLGCLDMEHYTHFKALGLKQYAEIKLIDGRPEFDYHVAGMPREDPQPQPDGTTKNRGCTFFDKWKDPEEKLQHFSADMVVPASESHLNATYCIDEERSACVTDRDGNCMNISASSCILLIPKEFKLRQSFAERLHQTDEAAMKLAAERNFAGRI